jgi:hypothetical protein
MTDRYCDCGACCTQCGHDPDCQINDVPAGDE